MRKERYITFTRLHLIKSRRNTHTFLYYIHISMYNQINVKLPHIPIVHLYILPWFKIQRRFCFILSTALENITGPTPVTTYTTTYQNDPHAIINFYILIQFNTPRHFLRQPVSWAIKYCTIQTCHNLQKYTHARFSRHGTLLNTTTFSHCTVFILKYIPSIWIIFPLVDAENSNSNINSRFLWLRTCWTCYIATKVIYYFYSTLVILEVLLNVFLYTHTFSHLPVFVKYFFTQLRELLITYLFFLCKYY